MNQVRLRVLLGLALFAGPAAAQAISNPNQAREHGLESLRLAIQQDGGVPLPENLGDFVINENAARVLGKALFHEMAAGSDGIQSCATCHFHAGADNRLRNQINPNLTRVANDREADPVGFFNAAAAPDTDFETATPNTLVNRGHYPFVRDIGDGDNVVDVGGVLEPAPGNSHDTTSSHGVALTTFVATIPGGTVDLGIPQFDPVFNQNGHTVRRVEPRNTPTTINAVFNFDNFWDGRAKNEFNGVDPFGNQSCDAKVFCASEDGLEIEAVSISMKDASLASQAVGPPLSDFEMSWAGRTFPDLGRKLIPSLALANQFIAPDDSLLASRRHPMGYGLINSYKELIQSSFHPKWWRSWLHVHYPADGSDPEFVLPGTTDPDRTYTLMEANFSLFWGTAIMLYEATLVADRTPFDVWMEGNGHPVPGFGRIQLEGLNVFVNEGSCVNCHGGPELTNASVRNAQGGDNLIEPMAMADGRLAVYDNGFYNIGITPTTDDIGRGGADPWGRPLASSRQILFAALGIMDIPFDIVGAPIPNLEPDPSDPTVLGGIDEDTGEFVQICVDVDGDGKCGVADTFLIDRSAVDGNHKTPGLRNRLLQGPYFHSGSVATLMEVVEFYNRGGNFCRTNRDDLDTDIQQLGLTLRQKQALVAFLMSLTDPRVGLRAAPFDGPQIFVPNGHLPDGTTVLMEVKATGASGLPSDEALRPFLNANPFQALPVSGLCSPNFDEPAAE